MRRKSTIVLLSLGGLLILVMFQNFGYVDVSDLASPAKITWVQHVGSLEKKSHLVLYGVNFSVSNNVIELSGLGCSGTYRSPFSIEQSNQIHFVIPSAVYNRNCQISLTSNGSLVKWSGPVGIRGSDLP